MCVMFLVGLCARHRWRSIPPRLVAGLLMYCVCVCGFVRVGLCVWCGYVCIYYV